MTTNQQNIAQAVKSGIAAGHTHITYHLPSVGQVTLEIGDDIPQWHHDRAIYPKTGFGSYANHSVHSYRPALCGVCDDPDDWFAGQVKFANQP